jgi:hypothetical protein
MQSLAVIKHFDVPDHITYRSATGTINFTPSVINLFCYPYFLTNLSYVLTLCNCLLQVMRLSLIFMKCASVY